MPDFRIERDSMGEVSVPKDALYAAQTQRAVDNFQISGISFSRSFIRALGLVKQACAQVNQDLDSLDAERADAIVQAAGEVADGKWDEQFPIDIFQTGSGTSTNMNANEVIANRCKQILGEDGPEVHPNDHVNRGQSSNDIIPTVIHVAAYMEVHNHLLPAISHLQQSLAQAASDHDDIIKTGRTHLMDATPIRLGQEFSGYAAQVQKGAERIQSALPNMAELALGGTAVGTGVNTHPEFGRRLAQKVADATGLPFVEAPNHFEAQAAQDGAVELSGQLKTFATSLIKIANDLRWMNSGPVAGLGEIQLQALQPGSSIMPGKVNPVIPEALLMVCYQVIGNDLAITLGGQSGVFELNVALPVMAHNLLESIMLLGNACRALADKAVDTLTVNKAGIEDLLERNAILATALAPIIGYDKATEVVKTAMAEGKRVREVARGLLPDEELDAALDVRKMTEPSA